MAKTDSSNPPLSAVEVQRSVSSDDDVSLLELWGVLTKRKGLIFIILLSSVIAAVLLIFFTPPVYESRAVAQIGQIGQIGQIEPPVTLVKRLLEQHGEHAVKDERVADGKALIYVQTASLEKDTNLVTITTRGPTPNAVQDYLSQVLDKLMKEHRRLFDNAQNEQQQYLNLIQVRSHEMSQVIEELDKGIRTITPKDEVLRAILSQEKSKLFEQQTALEQKQMELRMAMSEFKSKPTVLIKAPTLTADPVKPRPLLYFALAIGIGLMLGISGAFVTEFISKTRRLASS